MINNDRYAGVDWGTDSHHVLITRGNGGKIGEKVFTHGGEGLAAMAVWLVAASGPAEPGQIHIAIEVPHGPVVEKLIERGFSVWATNPKHRIAFVTASGSPPLRTTVAASAASNPSIPSLSSAPSGPASPRIWE